MEACSSATDSMPCVLVTLGNCSWAGYKCESVYKLLLLYPAPSSPRTVGWIWDRQECMHDTYTVIYTNTDLNEDLEPEVLSLYS